MTTSVLGQLKTSSLQLTPLYEDFGRYSWVPAYNRATDAARRGITRVKTRTAAEGTLKRVQSGRPWLNLNGAERAEAMDLIRAAIACLPGKQQIVMRVFVDHYP